jgi:hypothetical protein
MTCFKAGAFSKSSLKRSFALSINSDFFKRSFAAAPDALENMGVTILF